MLSAHRCLEVFGMNRSDRLRVRKSDRRNRRFRPIMEIEKLEPRIAMSHGTVQLGVVQPGQNSAVGGKLARYSLVDFEFQVNAPIIVGAKLSGLSANAELSLLNANKQVLSTFYNGKGNDSFIYSFAPGVYYARIVELSRRKSSYQIDVTATSLPTPKPVTPPASTTTPASTSSIPPASTSPASTTTGPASGPTGTTFLAFEQELATGTTEALNQFIQDAQHLESVSPTWMSRTIIPELNTIQSDVQSGNDFQAFSDIQEQLAPSLYLEAEISAKFFPAPQERMLANTQVYNDLVAVAICKELNYAVLEYIASHTQYHSTTTTAPVWTTSVLPSGNAGGTLTQTQQTSLTQYSSPSLSTYNYRISQLTGAINASATYDDESQSSFAGVGEDGAGAD
jgi:hypothetical protein